MGFISKQPKFRGVVVLSRFTADNSAGFGFIEPEGSDGNRANNVWFGATAVQRLTVSVGDIVAFYYSKTRNERGPRAGRVWVQTRAADAAAAGHITYVGDDREQITYVGGE